MTETRNPILDAALEFLKAGISILPCRMPDKTPDFNMLPRSADGKATWEPFRTTRALPADAERWFHFDRPDAAIGIIGGAVSGNLEILDIDNADYVPAWVAILKEENPALLKRLVVERTVRGRAHIIYRCIEPVPGSTKLARALVDGRPEGIFETKGEGGYAVCAPSPGYELLRGKIEELPLITMEERALIITAARTFNSYASEIIDAPLLPPDPVTGTRSDEARPGDEFNREADVRTLLERHGWTLVHQRGDAGYWRRPRKDRSYSATWNHVPGGFHVFSCNAAPLEDGKTYSPFALFALLECDGDFKRAASELRAAGYGASLTVLPGGKGPSILPPMPDAPTDAPGQMALSLAEVAEEEDPMDSVELAQVTPLPTIPQVLDDQTVLQCAVEGERGLGALCAAAFRGRFIYDHSGAAWYQWKGHYWAECRTAEYLATLEDIQVILKTVARRNRKTNKAAATVLTNAADTLRRIIACKHVLEFAAAGSGGVGIRGDEWDLNGWLLGCPNGTLDLRTAALKPGDPLDYIRTTCPTPYDEAATAPRFEQFIREIMPDPQIAGFLHRLLGYGITGRSTEHVFPVFLGESSRNGKGTLLETIGSVLGNLARPLPARTLMAQTFQESHDAQAMVLRGRRLLWASETGDRQKLDSARVKLWTGGDTITGRAPYAKCEITFTATHKIILLSNFKPRLSADDKAMWNRILLIPFLETFVDAPDANDPHQHLRDRGLMDTLHLEAPGILRWLVKGCMEWATMGLLPPKSIQVATQRYHAEEDLIGQFLVENTAPQQLGDGAGSKEVYDRYRSWCALQNERPLGPSKFAIALERRGHTKSHTRIGNRYNGFTLTPEAT